MYEWTEGLVPPFLRCFWGDSFAVRDGGRNVRAPNRQLQFNWLMPKSWGSGWPERSLGQRRNGPGRTRRRTDRRSSGFPAARGAIRETGKPYLPHGVVHLEPAIEQDLDEMAAEGVNAVIFVESPTDVDRSDASWRSHLVAMTAVSGPRPQRGIKVLVHLAAGTALSGTTIAAGRSPASVSGSRRSAPTGAAGLSALR